MSDTSFMDEAEETLDNRVMDEVGKMIRMLRSKEAEIGAKETELKLLKADEDQLLKVAIPQMFKKHGMSTMGMEDGALITVSEELACSLIKDPERRTQALIWLINKGGEDLIKNVAVIEDPSPTLLQLFNERGVLYSMSKDVNANSLKAWFREKLGLKQGMMASIQPEEVPKEFGLYLFDLAKVKEAPKRR